MAPRRRVSARLLAGWFVICVLLFDAYQLWRTGTWHPDLTLGNAAGSTVLHLAAGLIWSLDLRQPRHLLPATGAAVVGVGGLVAWSWP